MRAAALTGIGQHVLLSIELRAIAALGYAANVFLPRIAGLAGHTKNAIMDGIRWTPSTGTLRIIELKPNTASGIRAMGNSVAKYTNRLLELKIRFPDLIIGNSGGTNPVYFRLGDVQLIEVEQRFYNVPFITPEF